MIINHYKTCFLALFTFLVGCSHGDYQKVESTEIAKEVNAAFTAIRQQGDISLVAELDRHGDVIVKYVSPWLSDDNASVRVEAVMLLHALGGERSAVALVAALSDSSEDVRERSSRSLYRYLCDTKKQIRYEPELIKGVELGRPSAAALLLLGGTKAGEKLLLKYRSETRPVRLFQYSHMIPTALAANVALSRLGDEEARIGVDAAIKSGDYDALHFLLQAINSIDSPILLCSLAKQTLSDLRETQDDEFPVHMKPARRVADMAVNIFVKRLQLNPSFELTTSQRYESKNFESLLLNIKEAINGLNCDVRRPVTSFSDLEQLVAADLVVSNSIKVVS